MSVWTQALNSPKQKVQGIKKGMVLNYVGFC